MALSIQDIVKGFDFTGLTSASASQHNQLVDMATLADDGSGEGKGVILRTLDTAFNTPYVPNPNAVVEQNKWKRYLWLRVPHSSATSQKPVLYGWNDNVTSDATYLKWIDTSADVTQIELDITTLEASVNTANTNSNTALATANAAVNSANTASLNADAANTTANTANSTANGLQASIDTANTTANSAAANATAALTAATANKNLKYVKITETQGHGVNGGGSVAGANVRPFNTEDNDDGNLAAVDGSGKITLIAGTYRVNISCTARENNPHQALLVKDSDNTILIIGLTTYPQQSSGAARNTLAHIRGLITLTDSTKIRVDHYFTDAVASSGLGLAGSIGPSSEVYAIAEFEKLD